jgi:hypothetical protein
MIRGTRNGLPRPTSARRTNWTVELGEAFLARVRETGNAAAAARAAGAAVHVFYSRMRRDAGFRRRFREAAAAGRSSTPAAVRWSPELGERFLAIVRETGNARQAALRLGAPNAFCNMMRRDPAFRQRALDAAAEADARLARAESAFPALPLELKSLPPDDGPPPGRRRPPPPPIAKVEPLPTDAEALGGYLRPARKRPQSRPQPVIRRNSKGRMQVTFAQEGHWTEEIEADFLAFLRATGNFEASARAVGFDPSAIRYRMKSWAAFERDCEEAFEEADVTLRYRLVAHANALMRSPGEAEAAGIEEEQVPFDPIMAMKILSHIDARRYGRSGKGRRKGPPERTFEQACDSILRKIEAIERHEAMMKARQEGGDASSEDPGRPGDDGK